MSSLVIQSLTAASEISSQPIHHKTQRSIVWFKSASAIGTGIAAIVIARGILFNELGLTAAGVFFAVTSGAGIFLANQFVNLKDFDTSNAELAQLNQKVATQNQKETELNTELERNNTALRQLEVDYKQQLETSSANENKLTAQLKTLEKQLADAAIDLTRNQAEAQAVLNEKTKMLNDEISKLQDQLQQENDELTQLKQAIENTKEKERKLQSDLITWKAENERYKQEALQYREQNTRLKQQVEELSTLTAQPLDPKNIRSETKALEETFKGHDTSVKQVSVTASKLDDLLQKMGTLHQALEPAKK